MSDETPWGRFPDEHQHPAFGKAYRLLDAERRAKADSGIAIAADQMHALLGHPLLKPLPWPGLSPRVAASVDMAIRTFLAMGVFRVASAQALGSQRTTLSDGLDQAADNVDRRAAELALRQLAETCPTLATVRPSDAAYHHLLNRLMRQHTGIAFTVAQLQSDPSTALDLTLETGLKHSGLASIVAHQEKIRRQVQAESRAAIAGSDLPLEAAVALWMLALMGMGRVFGEDDQTVAYADY